MALTSICKMYSNLRIGLVACHEHPQSCDSRAVHEYPTLRAYRKGSLYKTFHGLFKERPLSQWMRMLNQPVLLEAKESNLPSLREGMVPGFAGEVIYRG